MPEDNKPDERLDSYWATVPQHGKMLEQLRLSLSHAPESRHDYSNAVLILVLDLLRAALWRERGYTLISQASDDGLGIIDSLISLGVKDGNTVIYPVVIQDTIREIIAKHHEMKDTVEKQIASLELSFARTSNAG